MTKKEIIDKLREDYEFLEKEYNIEKVGIFGSYALEKNTEESDIDILVKLKKPIGFKFFELVDFLERELGKKVDIITEAGLNGIRVKNIKKSIEESVIYV